MCKARKSGGRREGKKGKGVPAPGGPKDSQNFTGHQRKGGGKRSSPLVRRKDVEKNDSDFFHGSPGGAGEEGVSIPWDVASVSKIGGGSHRQKSKRITANRSYYTLGAMQKGESHRERGGKP